MFQRNFTRITDNETIYSFIRENNFGQLISDDPLQITHLPFMIYKTDIEGKFRIEGHFAKANSHWKDLDKKEVMLVFTGPHGYITPSVYINKDVPTWNYSAIHLKGTIQLVDDDRKHKEILHNLVNNYEIDSSKWNFDMLDPNNVKRQYANTVSFVIETNDIDAKFKMSQNKTLEDRREIIKKLEQGDCKDKLLANFMKKHVSY